MRLVGFIKFTGLIACEGPRGHSGDHTFMGFISCRGCRVQTGHRSTRFTGFKGSVAFVVAIGIAGSIWLIGCRGRRLNLERTYFA